MPQKSIFSCLLQAMLEADTKFGYGKKNAHKKK